MFLALLLSSLPRLLGEELGLDVEGSVVAGVLLLLGGGGLGEGHLEDGEEPLLVDSDEPLLPGLPHVHDLLLADVDDHVQPFDLPADDLCDPEGLVHELLGGLDGDEALALAEEEGEGAADVHAWVRGGVP